MDGHRITFYAHIVNAKTSKLWWHETRHAAKNAGV